MKTGVQEPKDRPELLRHKMPKSNAPWHCRQTLPMFALHLTACATPSTQPPSARPAIPSSPSVGVKQPQVCYSFADGRTNPHWALQLCHVTAAGEFAQLAILKLHRSIGAVHQARGQFSRTVRLGSRRCRIAHTNLYPATSTKHL